MISQIAALVLAVTAPYPAAQKVPDSRDQKFTEGKVAQVSPAGDVVTLDAPIGQVTLLTSNARVQGADNASSTVQQLTPGEDVRVYYRVQDGARVQEIDVVPPKQ